MFLYSDALIETEDKYGSVWSEDAIIYYIQHLLLEYNNLNGELLYNKILDNFTSHYANNVRDDLTINIYHRLK